MEKGKKLVKNRKVSFFFFGKIIGNTGVSGLGEKKSGKMEKIFQKSVDIGV